MTRFRFAGTWLMILVALTTMNAQAQIEINSDITHVSCNGGSDGAVDVTVSGGMTPYNYLWNNGATTEDIANLKANTYTLRVTDAEGSVYSAFITVNEPEVLTVEVFTERSELCAGESTSAYAIASGGTGQYTFKWNDPEQQTGVRAVELSGGEYTVTVTDENACKTLGQFYVFESDPIEITTSIQSDVTCKGADNGIISLSVSGGKAPYFYKWSNGASSSRISNLAPGNYEVTVFDDLGCVQTASYTISEPDIFNNIEIEDISVDHVTCNGGSNGSALISLADNGNLDNYQIEWQSSDGGGVIQNSSYIAGLAAGTYQVTITDENECKMDYSFVITEPQGISIDSTDIFLPDETDFGKIKIYADGGAGYGNLLYSIDNGETYHDNNGLFDSVPVGRYVVAVKDENACVKVGDVVKVLKSVSDTSGQTDIQENDFESPDFKLYPNPSDGLFYAQFKNYHKENFRLLVYDISGETIYQKSYQSAADHVWTEIDLTHFPKGMYIVSVISDHLNYRGRVIIK